MDVKSVFMVVNVDWFFLSHRLPIALEAQKKGYKVTIIAGNTGKVAEIKQHGFDFINFPLARGRTSFKNELKAIFFLFKLYIFHKPTIIHQVGLKIIIFGTIAHSISFSKAHLVNALSGAGTMFTSSPKNNRGFILLLKFFHFFTKKKSYYIFQNQDDLNLFRKLSNKIQRFSIIKGSGVDVDIFQYKKTPSTTPKIVLFVGRLLKEKGVVELLEVAKLLQNELYGKIKFVFLGNIDVHNPSSLSQDLLNKSQIENYIEFKGHIDRVLPYLETSYIVVLPSYREGLPKALIEACAVGKAIITTNTIGCKEVVVDGKNGFLVPVGDVLQLAQKIKQLIEDESKVIEFGLQSRLKAETEFALSSVVLKTLEIYQLVCE